MKLKPIIFAFLLMVTIASGQADTTPQKPQIDIESTNPDGSYVLVINGRRYRALTEGQLKTVWENQRERNVFRNDFVECNEKLKRQNEAE